LILSLLSTFMAAGVNSMLPSAFWNLTERLPGALAMPPIW
jgi:hypothetical protein